MSGTPDAAGTPESAEELYRLREMFVKSPSFSALLQGPEHRFVLANPAYHQLIGRRNVIGLTVREAVPELEGQGFFELLDNVLASGEPFVGKDLKIVLERAPGAVAETRYLDFVYQPIKNELGNVTSIFVEGLDITERRATEQALRELNANLERRVIERPQARGLTWQLSPDLLGALNSNGYFETSNPAWQTVLGWSEAEVASMSIFELLHPDDVEHTRAGFELTLVGQPAIRFENRYRCKDGSYRWISWVGIQEDNFVYCTGRDITAERESEIELSKAQDALRQSQKMEAIGQLTGGIAHDFNNLLTGILASLDLMRRRMAANKPEDALRFMDAASTSAQRAAALTHRLLAFARRQLLDTRPNDINRLIASMEDLLIRTLGEHIELNCTLAGDLWTAFTDANQLENAILNLAINARDAMPNGGRLSIQTANVRLDEAYTASQEDVQPGEYVVVGVSDTGMGMSPEVLSKAIDPFFTTKPIGEGTGLGLSGIYGFARQSQGHLRIYSELGQGTTVKLYLPRAKQNSVDPQTATVETPRGQGETILMVEDDATVRLIVRDALEDLGYNILLAPDARTALPLLQSNQRIDLLISDVVLPHVNGRKLAEMALNLRPNLNVLFISGYAENAIHGDFLEPGMEMLTKPFTLDDLGAKVHAMINRKVQ
ncbi:MAG: PAS domain S-box protein [Pseudomonadota bacterium]|nr:PAS domain S-box protein [Pseudomonadota bacterium]